MRRLCAIALMGLLVAACVRGEPPAPVSYRGGGGGGNVQASPATAAPASVQRQAASRPDGKSGVHTVARGDTVYGIARRYQVPLRAVIDANGLVPPYHLRVGQRLRIPESNYHVVARGDTLYSISRAYDVDMHELARLNALGPPYTIRPGETLRLPGTGAQIARVETGSAGTRSSGRGDAEEARDARRSGRTRAPEPPPQARREAQAEGSGNTEQQTETGKEEIRTVNAATAPPQEIPRPPARDSAGFLWPVRGEILVPFGSQEGGLHNDGINVAAPIGTPVRAAENGVVAYVGNELRGFGNLLLIKHDDDWITAYAHLDEIIVERGQEIRRGEAVARIGKSGGVSAPQLHFEVREGSRARDPLSVLGDIGA